MLRLFPLLTTFPHSRSSLLSHPLAACLSWAWRLEEADFRLKLSVACFKLSVSCFQHPPLRFNSEETKLSAGNFQWSLSSPSSCTTCSSSLYWYRNWTGSHRLVPFLPRIQKGSDSNLGQERLTENFRGFPQLSSKYPDRGPTLNHGRTNFFHIISSSFIHFSMVLQPCVGP